MSSLEQELLAEPVEDSDDDDDEEDDEDDVELTIDQGPREPALAS